MQKMLADEAPAVWLYMHPRLVVTKKGVTGHLEGPAGPRPSTCPRSAGRSSAAMNRRPSACGGTRCGGSLRASLRHPLLRLACSSSSCPRAARRSRRCIILGTEGSPEAVGAPARGAGARPADRRPVRRVDRRGPSAGDLGRSRSSTTCRWRGLILSRLTVTLPLTLLAAGAHGRGRRSRSASSRPPATAAGATTSR